MAAGNAFIVSGPPKIAVIWFGDNERALCTTIGSLAGAVGSILGFVLPIVFFSEDNKNLKRQFVSYIFYQSIIITVMSFPIIILI